MEDLNKLFRCCKVGDIETLKDLIDNKDIDFNTRDKWDSTPLYYACLCGHINLVRYLLKSGKNGHWFESRNDFIFQTGARCESNTFDGERCVYGALTSEIRNVLLNNHNIITSKIIRRNDYDEFLRKIFEYGDYFDVIFSVHKQIFKVHRCVLASRCDYFNDMFNNKWKNRKFITINNTLVFPYAFEAVIKFLYTGRLEVFIDQVDDVKAILKQCKLNDLLIEFEKAIKKTLSFKRDKPGTNVTTVLVEKPNFAEDFHLLVQQSLPSKHRSWVDGNELPFLPDLSLSPFSDIIFKVEDEIFKCHKVFFCCRSEFFRAFLTDHFLEAHQQINDVQVFTIRDISVEAFIGLINFVYQNRAVLTQSTAYELLFAADLFLLSGLKKQSSDYIMENLMTVDTVFTNIRYARLMQLDKLESQCCEFIAKNLEKLISDSEFHLLIKEDAENVRERQETDSIDIIDDIRYHISSVQGFSALAEANSKLLLIDELLEQLQLDA